MVSWYFHSGNHRWFQSRQLAVGFCDSEIYLKPHGSWFVSQFVPLPMPRLPMPLGEAPLAPAGAPLAPAGAPLALAGLHLPLAGHLIGIAHFCTSFSLKFSLKVQYHGKIRKML